MKNIMKNIMKNKVVFWSSFGFVIGILMLFYVNNEFKKVEEFCANQKGGCDFSIEPELYLPSITLMPFMLLFAPFYVIGALFQDSRISDISLNIIFFGMRFGYPLAYALYGALIGWGIERRKRLKNKQ